MVVPWISDTVRMVFENSWNYREIEPKSRHSEIVCLFEVTSSGESSYFFSEAYCGGYSGEDPPLPIPNREVKLTIADGTAPPGGRVGSCHESYDTLSS